MRARVAAIGVAVVGVLALLPGVAHAAFLGSSGATITFNAQAAEANNLTVEVSGANFVFTDAPGITITPTAPCATIAANKVSCPTTGVSRLSISLNDQSDAVTIAASVGADIQSSISGGDADDTLTSLSEGRGNFTGDTGNDTVSAGGGSDFITDGLGTDSYSGGGGVDFFSMSNVVDGADTVAGGASRDSISYSSRTVGVTLTLDGVANDGEACPGAGCEGDNVGADVETVSGGGGDDLLTGTDADESFSGLNGADVVDSGGGDDRVNGGSGDDTVSGGDGNDFVSGDDGADTMNGGAGDDELDSEFDDVGADVASGGAGLDSLTEAFSNQPLAISLNGVADDGVADPAFPRDNIGTDVENAIGSEANDVLIGNDAANELDGGAGNDVLVGAGGDDSLLGGDGDDSLDGGAEPDTLDGAAGVDFVRSRDGGPDQLDCGSSADTVIGDSFDLAPASCENVAAGVVIVSAKVKGKKVKLKLSCPAAEGADCPVSAKLAAKGEKIATGSGIVAAGQTQAIKLKLNNKGKELVADKPKLKADATVTYTDATGAAVVTSGKVALG